MRIQKIETIPIEVPLVPARALLSGNGYHTVSPFLLVLLHTDDGHCGLGEVSCTPQWSGEDHATAAHLINKVIAPLLVGSDPSDLTRLVAAMDKRLANNPFTKAGVEMALWDLLGKRAGLPVHVLLGGKVRDRVKTKYSISGLAPQQAAEIAVWAVEQGFDAMKVKVGLDPAEDLERVRAVRSAVGPNVRLGVDANGGWTVHDAVWCLQELEPCAIAFAEQPVPAVQIETMAYIRARSKFPILADESVGSPRDALTAIGLQAADAISVYVGKSGGISNARRIMAVADSGGLRCTIGSNLELGVGSAAMIHLALASREVDDSGFPCDILTPFFYSDDIVVGPSPMRAGHALPLEGPGLGVDLDWEKVDSYRVDGSRRGSSGPPS